MEILHESNIFQEPWLPTYTKAEVSLIFQNQFLATTQKVLKDYVNETPANMAAILTKCGPDSDEDLSSSYADSDDEQDTSSE